MTLDRDAMCSTTVDAGMRGLLYNFCNEEVGDIRSGEPGLDGLRDEILKRDVAVKNLVYF